MDRDIFTALLEVLDVAESFLLLRLGVLWTSRSSPKTPCIRCTGKPRTERYHIIGIEKDFSLGAGLQPIVGELTGKDRLWRCMEVRRTLRVSVMGRGQEIRRGLRPYAGVS